MNFSWHIAKRMLKNEKGEDRFARPVLRIAVWSIALGIAVMILSLSVVTGFQEEIRNKVIGFGAHIQITAFNANPSLESDPVLISQDFYPSLNDEPGVKNIQVYAYKPSILQSQELDSNKEWRREIQGVLIKGVSGDYNWDFLSENLVEGRLPDIETNVVSQDILISRTLASRLRLHVNDTVSSFFISNNAPRERKLKVCGIYHTGMDELDKKLVFIDLKHLRVINNWGITAMLYVRNDVKDGKLIIEADGRGSGNYLFDFGNGFSTRSTLLLKPGADTTIRVVVASTENTLYGETSDEFASKWIPDTAWLALSYYPKITAASEYELESNPEVEQAGDTHFVYHHPGLNVIAKMHNSGGSGKYYAGGFEVLLNNWNDLQDSDEFIYKNIGPEFQTKTIRELHQDLFQWLSYLDLNIWVILTLMLLVSLINMCSTLLVLILERTNMIGLLKALGASNKKLQMVFFYNGVVLIGKGLIIGNIIAIGFALLQWQTGFLSLDQSTYFIDTVPIRMDILSIILLNAGTMIICMVTLLLPTWLVSRISPIKAIRFD
ncbi:MAG TPA: hypothetical protein DEP18_05855 [Flavobacteriales bacterium]|nr:hypothetical protein [Flavobacteriales bacterium]HRE73952.1 ABC transporter permease [Flavobacteriales bacterium]HRE96610.1 ABC transporter permease [Flavobacteriales bacterium]HRJ39010.1 ABC transporter permease [Flavobacteriales bacterium]